MSHTRHSIIVYHKNACSFHFLPRKSKKPPLSRELQLIAISKLGLNHKIKKFSYSFICGKGNSPPSGGESLYSVQSSSFKGADALSRVYERQRFLVSGVRCQIRSLYSRIVRSEENTPLLATLMISLRVHFF